ncbi:MAG TPA: arginine--tRNA ligase, partial [Mesotoga infera]|nr:arginine--tRNA ligase [Mesotoga infera]
MLKEKLKDSVNRVLQKMGIEEEIEFKIEIPPEGFGDLSTNAAFLLSRIMKKNPREIASIFVAELQKELEYDRVEIAGPGFINVDFSSSYLSEVLREMLSCPDFWRVPENVDIQFEFASANPT